MNLNFKILNKFNQTYLRPIYDNLKAETYFVNKLRNEISMVNLPALWSLIFSNVVDIRCKF